MEKTLFSTPELAEWLGVFHTTVRRWIEGGRIKGIRVGRNYKIPADEVIRILEGHGIPLPEVVMNYKSNKQNAAARSPGGYGGYQGSILRKLLVVEEITEPAFVCRNAAILGANQAFAELVGYPQEELMGLHVAVVVNEQGNGGICDFAKKRVETPFASPESYVTQLKTGSNQGHEVHITANALDGLRDIYVIVVKKHAVR